MIAFAAACVALVRGGRMVVLVALAAAFAAANVCQTRESASAWLGSHIATPSEAGFVVGCVIDAPVATQSKTRFTVETTSIGVGSHEYQAAARVAVTIPAGVEVSRSDTVRISGTFSRPEPARNPAAFDEAAWLRLRGVYALLRCDFAGDFTVLKSSPWSPGAIAERCKAWMESCLKLGIESDATVVGLLAGMILGVTSTIPEDLQDDFRATGTYHLFSVSGLHVGMIAVILWQVMALVSVPLRARVLLIIPALFFYALITGWKPPSIRAATMSAIFLAAMVSARQPVAVNSLCAAAFLILAQWTSEVFNPGFQLSFLVVLSILLIGTPAARWLRMRLEPDPFIPPRIYTWSERVSAGAAATLAVAIGVSFAAWFGSLPLILAYFHMISLSALLVNLAVVPLAFLIMSTALVSLVGGLVSATWAAIFNNANWLFTKILLLVVQAGTALPGSHFFVAVPQEHPVAVTVFDFGAGGAAAIETAGRLWLVDTGPDFEAARIVRPWLRSRGRDAPDGIVLSHGDAKHIGGALRFADARPVFVDSLVNDRSPTRGRIHRELAAAGIPKFLRQSGDRVEIASGAVLEILHPPAGMTGVGADDKVLVVKLVAAGWRVLFLSDAGWTTERWLLQQGIDVGCDVLVLGRHRSGLPLESAFLEAANPGAVVVTAGSFPESEPVDEQWAAEVLRSGRVLFRQDRTGAVEMTFDARRAGLRGFLNGQSYEFAPIRPVRCEPSHR